jgi:hypothetical protein
LYYGDSFLSQSSRFMMMDTPIKKIEVFNRRGKTRTLVRQ